MALVPLSGATTADMALIPIGQDVPFQDWRAAVPAPAVKPDLLASINEIAGQIGTIFDSGWAVYEKIAGRTTANEQIAGETLPAEKQPVIIQQTMVKGFYELYNENRAAVLLVGGGLVLLTTALMVKKLR